MKKVKLFVLDNCPFCHEALRYMDELCKEHPEYGSVEVEIIDEQKYPSIANAHDYYYVPTYYVGDVKVHEGACTKEQVKNVYVRALAE